MRLKTALAAAAIAAVTMAVWAFGASFSRDVIYCENHRYYFDKEINGETAEDEEFEFEFEVFKDAAFTVNTVGQADITLSANCDYDEQAAEKYPEAELLFFNGNGDYFYHYGTLFLPAKEGSFLYRNINRTFYDIGVVYDENEKGFLVKTRNLSQYVISDKKLEVEKLEEYVDAVDEQR